MSFEHRRFKQLSIEDPRAQYAACVAELRRDFARDWGGASPSPPLAVPLGDIAPCSVTVPADIERSWAVTPSDMSQLGSKIKRLVRIESPVDHAATALLNTKHQAFRFVVEILCFDVATRFKPWGGVLPTGIHWVVSEAGPPTVFDFGVALTATYTLEAALEEAGVPLPLEPEPGIPEEWSNTTADAIRWEIAASRRLTISNAFKPPLSTIDRGFHEFKNPFLQLCSLWRCGVVVKTRFDAGPVLIAVNRRRL